MEIDDFNKSIVHHNVQEFYNHGNYPMSEKLIEILSQKMKFFGSMKIIMKILKNPSIQIFKK